MEIVFLLLLLGWLSEHPIYLLYYAIFFVVAVLMIGFTPRLAKAVGIGIPLGWIVYLYFDTKLHPVDLTKYQTIACYAGTILVLWIFQIIMDWPEIKAQRQYRKELKQMQRKAAHPAPVGFVPEQENNSQRRRHSSSSPVPIGFQPPGTKKGSSIAWSQKNTKNTYQKNSYQKQPKRTHDSWNPTAAEVSGDKYQRYAR